MAKQLTGREIEKAYGTVLNRQELETGTYSYAKFAAMHFDKLGENPLTQQEAISVGLPLFLKNMGRQFKVVTEGAKARAIELEGRYRTPENITNISRKLASLR